jgi:hypothetical protein
MRVVGLMRELEPFAKRPLPSIEALRDGLDPAVVEPLVAYLREGDVAADCMEWCTDPLDPKVGFPGGSGIQSDGQWVWRQDLWHYVSRYRVGLDEEFVRHVLTGVPPRSLSPAEMGEALRAYDRALRPP